MISEEVQQIQPPKEICIFQYNQIKGQKEGQINHKNKHQWTKNNENGQYMLEMDKQKVIQKSKNYLIAVVEEKTGKIEWKDAVMMEVRTKAVEEAQSQTLLQKWSLDHKRNMVSQFGTSKSKRKVNQMMNNIIE